MGANMFCNDGAQDIHSPMQPKRDRGGTTTYCKKCYLAPNAIFENMIWSC